MLDGILKNNFDFSHSLSDYQFLLTLAHLRSQLQSGPPLTPMMMSSLLANPLNNTPLVANSGTREIMDQLLQLQMQQTQTVLALQQQLPTQVSHSQFEQNLGLTSVLTSRLPAPSASTSRPPISSISQKRKADTKNDQIVPISIIKDRSSDHDETSDHPIETESQSSLKRRKYSSEKKSYRIADLLEETSQDENVDIEVIDTCNSSISIKPLNTSTPKKG